MRNRTVVALFVAFLLSLPALAQQPASSTPERPVVASGVVSIHQFRRKRNRKSAFAV